MNWEKIFKQFGFCRPGGDETGPTSASRSRVSLGPAAEGKVQALAGAASSVAGPASAGAPPESLPPRTGAQEVRSPGEPSWLLRRSDQAVVAALVVLGGLGMVVWAHCQADPEEGLVDIDQAEPLQADFRVDINQASWPELAQLPGIGPALARRIVEYRLSKGPFRCVKDLDKVPGIGPKKLEQIQPYLFSLPEECPSQPAQSP